MSPSEFLCSTSRSSNSFGVMGTSPWRSSQSTNNRTRRRYLCRVGPASRNDWWRSILRGPVRGGGEAANGVIAPLRLGKGAEEAFEQVVGPVSGNFCGKTASGLYGAFHPRKAQPSTTSKH